MVALYQMNNLFYATTKYKRRMEKISPELQVIDDMIMEIHDRIKSGRCLTNKLQNLRAIDFLHLICNKDEAISKYEACRYVGVSRATFDRLVSIGKLPKGKKRVGWTELAWFPKDLDAYIDKIVSN
jgi:predicted DNA-binding transcriptional regulator AlpA